MHEIEKESGGGLEPLQPSLASTRWRMGHPPIVRMIPKLVVWHRTFTYMLPRTGFHSSHRRRFLEYILFHIPIDLAMPNGFFLWITDKSTPLKLVAPTGFEPILLESESSILPIILRSIKTVWLFHLDLHQDLTPSKGAGLLLSHGTSLKGR